jgi:hypothetical protein
MQHTVAMAPRLDYGHQKTCFSLKLIIFCMDGINKKSLSRTQHETDNNADQV